MRWREQFTTLDIIILIFCCIVYIAHSLVFRDWIIDDAGISFAYSRNLAEGFGLVSQPGRIPVEGYSNPTWVFLMVPFFWLNSFDPVITPKIISAIMTVASFFIFYLGLKNIPSIGLANRAVVIFMLAITTPFVIWTSSGLENPLYVLLIVLLFYIFTLENHERNHYLAIGVISGLVAMTRPDGMLFIGLYPIWLWLNRRDEDNSLRKALMFFGIGVFVTFGLYFIFRMLYFGYPLPNTYYAKESVGLSYFVSVAFLIPIADIKLLELASSIFGVLRMWAFLITISTTLWLVAQGKFKRNYWIITIFLVWTTAIYMLLPIDWMAEYRFATAFYPFFYVYLILVTGGCIAQLKGRWKQRVGFFSISLFIALSAGIFLPRTLAFAKSPTVGFESVTERFATRFNEYAEDFNLEDASLLAPDLGGTLYYSDLTIYDLAGLTDTTVARTLYIEDKTELHDYIFETIQPTFIHIHGNFTSNAKLEESPRFEEDYVAICSYIDPTVLARSGEEMISGNFIRRDVINEENQAVFDRIQNEIINC